VLYGHAVEVPRANEDRVIVYEGKTMDGPYTRVDGFVMPGSTAIVRVDRENGTLVYRTFKGEVITTR
jgi:hypothetical protein